MSEYLHNLWLIVRYIPAWGFMIIGFFMFLYGLFESLNEYNYNVGHYISTAVIGIAWFILGLAGVMTLYG